MVWAALGWVCVCCCWFFSFALLWYQNQLNWPFGSSCWCLYKHDPENLLFTESKQKKYKKGKWQTSQWIKFCWFFCVFLTCFFILSSLFMLRPLCDEIGFFCWLLRAQDNFQPISIWPMSQLEICHLFSTGPLLLGTNQFKLGTPANYPSYWLVIFTMCFAVFNLIKAFSFTNAYREEKYIYFKCFNLSNKSTHLFWVLSSRFQIKLSSWRALCLCAFTVFTVLLLSADT